MLVFSVCPDPLGYAGQSFSEKGDVEAQFGGPPVDGFLLFCEQVEEERGQTPGVKNLGDVAVSRAVSAASTAVDKQDDCLRALGDGQCTLKHDVADRNSYFSL